MGYKSTRLDSKEVSSKEALMSSLARDGGLYVMDLTDIKITDFYDLNYQDLAFKIIKELLPDLEEENLAKAIKLAYQKFDDKILDLKNFDEFSVLELFHGKTLAFKDMALSLLPELMKISLDKDKKYLILTATSGDTGSACLNAFKDIDNLMINVFYPSVGISKIQKDQMTKISGSNINSTAITGNFDDAQTAVKKAFLDEDFVSKLNQKGIYLTSANSINIARLIPQIVYYFYSYSLLVKEGIIKKGELVNYSVPTGNFGDVLACYYAKLIGLPVNKMIVATNKNNVLEDFIKTGLYDIRRDFYKTTSPSMDILISSNLERMLYYKSNGNKVLINNLMTSLKNNKYYQVSDDLLASIKQDFLASSCSDIRGLDTIKAVYDKYHYVVDPHTATAIKAFYDYKDLEGRTVIISTASPLKFIDTINASLKFSDKTNSYDLIRDYVKKIDDSDLRLLDLEEKEVIFKDEISKDKILEYLKERYL